MGTDQTETYKDLRMSHLCANILRLNWLEKQPPENMCRAWQKVPRKTLSVASG
jgi:hypothetical protein